MKTSRLLFLAIGLALLGYLVNRVGLHAVLASIGALSWRLLPVLVFPSALIAALHALGWRFAFRQYRGSFGTLFSARLAGEAFNVVTPTAALGGEPVKAFLLRPRVPLPESLAAVIVDKTTITVAQALFLAVGLAMAWLVLPLPFAFLRAMTGLLMLEVLALSGFVLVQRLGIFGRGAALVTRLGLLGRRLSAKKFRRLDRALAGFYRNHRGRLGISLLFHFLGWVLGSLEMYLILRLLGLPISPLNALVIEACSTSIRFMAFMIPGALGVLESGTMAVVAAFSLDASAGLTSTLIRRLRELIWVVVGLTALVLLEPSAHDAKA